MKTIHLALAFLSLAPMAMAETPVLTVLTYDSFAAEWGPGPAIAKGFEAECACTVAYVTAGDGAALLSRLQMEGAGSSADIVLGLDTTLTETARATGLFVQDQIDLSERWKLLAGVRFDRFHQDSENRLAATRQVQDHSSATPRIGVTYLIDANTSVYASAGRSFRPNAGTDESGRAFDPQKGQALELGAKWQSADQRLNASVALFDIRKTNVLTRSPTNANFSIAAGEVQSRGLELDVAGQIDAHWRMTANMAYTDTEVTRDNNAALLGKRLLNVPRVSAGLFAIREDQAPWGGRYGIGGGLVHVGERTGTATDTYRLPAYTTARITGYWQIDKRMRLTLDVHNLFDKAYYTASWGALTVIPGLGRQVVAGVQVVF